MDLYKLNKDMLVKLVATIRDETLALLSDEELKDELEKRNRIRKTKILKRGLLNLKSIPYLSPLIEKYEELINNMVDIGVFFENLEIRGDFQKNKLHGNNGIKSLYCDIYSFLRSDAGYSQKWPNSDEIKYFSCKSCSDHEIAIYSEYGLFVELTKNGGEWVATFIGSKDGQCKNCRERAW